MQDLVCACNLGFPDVVSLILEIKAGDAEFMTEIFGNEKSQKTPLIHSAIYNQPECFRFLIPLSNLNHRHNGHGTTALLQTLIYGHEECALLLLKEPEIDINVGDNCGYTPLMAACKNRLIRATALLIKMGADKEAQDMFGATATLEAQEFPEILELL